LRYDPVTLAQALHDFSPRLGLAPALVLSLLY